MRIWQSPGTLGIAVCRQMAWQMGDAKRVPVGGEEADSPLGSTLDKKLRATKWLLSMWLLKALFNFTGLLLFVMSCFVFHSICKLLDNWSFTLQAKLKIHFSVMSCFVFHSMCKLSDNWSFLFYRLSRKFILV